MRTRISPNTDTFHAVLLYSENHCDSCNVTKSSNTIGVQFQMMQYVYQVKTLSRDTPGFQKQDWLKNERDNEVEIRCSMNITKYGKCE